MKSLFLTAALLAASFATYAQTWSVDKAHAKVGFSVTHMMLSEVEGNFKTFDAKITATQPDFSDAVVEMTADVNSINTDNSRRDEHLKGPDFFDAAKYPTLTFKSKSFQKVDGKKYKMTGDLTMHGVTQPITLDVTLTGPVTMDSPKGKQEKAGFKITGTLKRSDFKIGNAPVAVIGDEIELKANAEFSKQASAVSEAKN